jgi:predicted metal-dependent phosphoesterase TrpH
MSVELHRHSLFSVDAWQTPEEIAEEAAAVGNRVLSLTDHNAVDGLARCAARSRDLGVRFIAGAEFDVNWQGREFHVLGFGFDPVNPGIAILCRKQFAQYTANFNRFLPIIQRRFGISRDALARGLDTCYPTNPAPVLNKWFAGRYLTEIGVFPGPAAARTAISEIAAEAESGIEKPWDWADISEVRDAVHDAGGILLLAHVAGYARGDLQGQLRLIEQSLAENLDGFELYHPANMAEPHFRNLRDAAKRIGCAVSGGSDSHSDSGRSVQAGQGFNVPNWVIETIDAALARRNSRKTHRRQVAGATAGPPPVSL